MVTPRQVVLAAELLIGGIFVAFWWARLRSSSSARGSVTLAALVIGFVAGVLDTFGIDGLATTAVAWRAFGVVDDERIPGTLQVGFVVPALAQALVLTTTLETHFNSLVAMVVAAAAGARTGTYLVKRWQPWAIGCGLGVALIVAGLLTILTAIRGAVTGGVELALHGPPLLIALAAYFAIGAFAAAGANSHTPLLLAATRQGMNTTAALPIVRAAGLAVGATAAWQFIRTDRYERGSAIGLTVGATAGVLATGGAVAGGLNLVRWPLGAVVSITGAWTLWSAARHAIRHGDA